MQAQPSLRELQLRMRELIRRPSAPAAPPPAAPSDDELLAGLPICGDDRLDRAARVAIYSGMYFVRIRDAIAEDYRALHAALGCDGFDALLRAYLTAHPPGHPSLRQAAARLAAFVARRPDLAPEAWHAPLARLEAAMVAAFDARDEEPLRASELEALAPEDWSGLELRPVASLVSLEPGFGIERVREALLEEPQSDAGLAERLAEHLVDRAVRLRVWRQGHTVFYRRMGAREAAALQLLREGASFGAVCEWLDEQLAADAALADVSPGDAAGDAASAEPSSASAEAIRLLQRWLEDELLARPHTARPADS